MTKFWKDLHQAICSTLKEEIPAIQTCDIYPSIRKELLAPALFVELVSLESGKDPGTEELALKARFEARIVIDSTIENAAIIVIALFTIIRTDRNMLLACYSHKHISYRIRTIIRKAILFSSKMASANSIDSLSSSTKAFSFLFIALFTIIRTDRNMLLACYSHKHISYRIRTIIRKAIDH